MLTTKRNAKKEIEKLLDCGVTDFYSGLAEGVDTWAAQIVLALREKNPTLKLHCILPCRDQAKKWEASAQKRHQNILEQANSVICLSESYYDGCMLNRNKYFVEHSSIILAVYDGNWRSRTVMTVRYAQKLGREII